jgi:radical SAM protein with 4Fe4S-binding SPASM domain
VSIVNTGYLKYVGLGAEYLFRRTRVRSRRVISLTIETTNICNFRCVYCPQSDPDNHFVNGKGTMSLDEFKLLLDNILQDFTPRFVSLHRDGEPLVNPRLEEYIGYARSRGLKVGISSNCSLLRPERVERLIDAGLAFVKTDFCADQDVYERLRTGGKWGQVFDGIVRLLTEARKKHIPFQMTMTDISTDRLPPDRADVQMGKLRSLFAEFGENVIVMPVHFHNALGESAESMGGGRGKRYTLCHHPWVHITVDFRGNVVPCCRDLRSEYICGNLLKEPMRDIWNNRRFQTLRRALADEEPEKIDICRKCDLPYRGSYSGASFAGKARNLLFAKIWRR